MEKEIGISVSIARHHHLISMLWLLCMHHLTTKLFFMNNNIKILIGTGVGLAAGAVLGILFAPEKGADTRKEINDQIKKLAETVEDSFNKGKEKFHDIKEKVEQAVKEKVEQYV